MPSRPESRTPPSDFKQIFIVARHEVNRYVKTKRFLGISCMTLVLVLFFFTLPFLSGDGYSGNRDELHSPTGLDSAAFPGYMSYVWLSHSDVVTESVRIFVNGSPLTPDEWTYYDEEGPVVLFRSNLTGSDVIVTYKFAMKPIEMAEALLYPIQYIIVFSASLLGADTLIGEIQMRTAYLVFPNPVRRSAIICGKLISSLFVGAVLVLLVFGTVTGLSLIFIGSVAEFLHISLAFALLFMLFCISLSFVVSATAKGSVGALITTLVLLLLISPLGQTAGASAGADVWYVPGFAADTIRYSLQWDDYPEDVTENTSVSTYYPEPSVSATVLLGYSIALVALSVIAYNRRELVGQS